MHVGDIVDLRTTITDEVSGEPADPDATRLEILLPDATTIVYVWPDPDEDEDELQLTREAEGEFLASFELTLEGTYNFNWTSTGEFAGSEPDQVFAHPRFMRILRPSLAHVAAVRNTRTYVDGADLPAGTQTGEFSSDTNPTDVAVELLIDEMVDDVRARFASNEVPESSWEAARRAIVCKVALAIELGDFPETAELSPFLQLRRDADEAIKSLTTAAQMRDLFGE